MAANPRMTNTDLTVTWDGVQTFVPKGTIVDVPAGSAMEAAYGLSNLVSLGPSSPAVLSGDTEPSDSVDAGGGST